MFKNDVQNGPDAEVVAETEAVENAFGQGEDVAVPVDDGDGDAQTEQAGDAPEENLTEEEKLKKLLGQETARAEDYYNRLVRLQADFENFRRRTQKEKEDFYKYASEQLIVALLPVMDNFQRALEARDDDPRKVIEGVEMIYRQIEDILNREGLEKVAAEGEEFDPTRHEAVMQEPAGEHSDNTVTQELRCGYCLKGKVIRPAMVKVAKA